MAELIVAGFKGTQRAAEVLDQILDLNASWAIDLKDAVAVYRTHDGRLRLDSSVQPTSKEGAAYGGLVGALLGGLIALPFTGGASAAVVAGAVGAGAFAGGTTGAVIGHEDAANEKAQWGISEELVKQVGGVVQPGNSAVFVLASSAKPEVIAEHFRGYGATIIKSTLTPEKTKRLQEVVAAR